MPFTEQNKPQFFECFLRKRCVRIFDAEGALRLYALSKELIVHILHDHVRTLHALLRLLRLSVPQI